MKTRKPCLPISHSLLLSSRSVDIGGGHGSGAVAPSSCGCCWCGCFCYIYFSLSICIDSTIPFSPIARHHSSNLNHHVLGYHHLFVLMWANFLRWRHVGNRLRCQRLLRRQRRQRLGQLRWRFWLSCFCVLFQPSRLALFSVNLLQPLFLRYSRYYYWNYYYI